MSVLVDSVKVGDVYAGPSGLQKKVISIVQPEGTPLELSSITFEVIAHGTKAPPSMQIGSVHTKMLKGFAGWAVSKVEVA